MNLAILGGGPLAIVLARIASSRGQAPYMWLREKEKSADNDLHSILPAATFVPSLSGFGNGSWLFLVCVPSAQAEDVIDKVIEAVDPSEDQAMLVFTEGIASSDVRRRTGTFGFAEYAEHLGLRRKLVSFTVAAAGGPNLITELQESAHTFVLLGTRGTDAGRSIGEQIRSDFIHVDYTDDLRGVEIGGALKNPISMAAGIVAGLPHTGSNVLGEFVAAGYREILLLGTALGGRQETLNGRAGLADLLANAFSPRSRNRMFGRQFVHRVMEGVDEPGIIERVQNFLRPAGIIEREMSRTDYLAEGGYALASIIDIAKELRIEVPIYSALHAVLSRKAPPEILLEQITGRGSAPAPQRPPPAGPGAAARRTEEDTASAVVRRVLDHLRSVHNARTMIKAAAMTVEERATRAGRVPEPERLVANTIMVSEGETFRTAVRDLTSMYARDIVGSLAEKAAKAAEDLDYSRLGLHVTPSVSGSMDEIRKAAAKNAIVYAATHRSHLDPVEIVAGLGAVGLPLPRFSLVDAPPSGELWEWIIKGVGGMRVPLQRARNPVYAACLRECHVVLAQRGVPVLVFPEGARSATGLIGGIRTGLLSPYIDAFHDSGREIAIVPLSLSYENVPDDVELCGLRDTVPFQDFLSKRTGVHLVVSPPIFVSGIAREEEAECALAARINAAWHRDLKILPQNIVARVISEYRHKIKESDLEAAVERFTAGRGGNLAAPNAKQTASDGLRHLVERGMVYVQSGTAESILRRLVDFYGAPASFDEESV